MADPNPSPQSLAEKHIVYQKLYKVLSRAFQSFDFPESSDADIHILCSCIAPCMGKDASDLMEIWKRRGGNQTSNAQFIAEVKQATDNGGTDYEFLLHKFSASVNTLGPERVDQLISSYLSEIRPTLKRFLTSAEPIELWVPDETDSEVPRAYTDFLKGLKIPASAKNGPDMLLHDLGNFKRSKALQQRIDKLFRSGSSSRTILLNTSGSGKTRTVLEGLCQKWGLYLTCHVDTEGRGSMDVQKTISERIEKDPCFEPNLPDTDFEKVHKVNCAIARRRFGEVLLARLCIFEFFCTVAREVCGSNLTAEHKRLWVFLQIRPSCLGPQHGDIFNVLTEKILGAEKRHCGELIKDKIQNIYHLVNQDTSPAPLFCVIDEAQVGATLLTKAFKSTTTNNGEINERPILRELVWATEELNMSLNITGTAINKQVIEAIMASPVLKDTSFNTVTHFGAFNVPGEQVAYMKQFLPISLAETPAFQGLFGRVAFWLKGRYRFTAAYMKDLLAAGFKKPHLMLNEFIRLSTVFPIPRAVGLAMSRGFKPSDSPELLEGGEVQISELIHFRFDKLKQHPSLEVVIRALTSQFWMRSSIEPRIASAAQFDLIACGFARYAETDTGNRKNPKITLDEPLALLALGEWLQIIDTPLAEMLRVAAAKAVTEANGANGLEEYLALYFSAVFDKETPLTKIFRFHEDVHPPEWAEHPATLVSLYTVKSDSENVDENTNSENDDEMTSSENDDEDGGEWEEVKSGPVEHQMRPSVTIGKGASTPEATLNWLSFHDDHRAPICFPDKFMGPDLVFILRLRDENRSLIWVALQSKFSSENTLPAGTIRKAITTVTPDQFYGLRKEQPVSDGNVDEHGKKGGGMSKEKRENYRRQVLELLDALPNRLLPPRIKVTKPRGRAKKQTVQDPKRRIIRHNIEESEKKSGPATRMKPLTAQEISILEGAGKHSVLRVVVGWPSQTSLHKRGGTTLSKTTDDYFDEEHHPIVELNIGHWGKTMKKLHGSAGEYVSEVAKGPGKRMADETELGDARPANKQRLEGGNVSAREAEPSVADILLLDGPSRPRITGYQGGSTRRGSVAGSVYTRVTSPPVSTAISTFSRSLSPMATEYGSELEAFPTSTASDSGLVPSGQLFGRPEAQPEDATYPIASGSGGMGYLRTNTQPDEPLFASPVFEEGTPVTSSMPLDPDPSHGSPFLAPIWRRVQKPVEVAPQKVPVRSSVVATRRARKRPVLADVDTDASAPEDSDAAKVPNRQEVPEGSTRVLRSAGKKRPQKGEAN
ncbi:hypothetical protein DFH09DRAFT_267454 [Mycena vulgaris]|nr:hypothetical protein DFH09DRAFT_267454 [Mycena vulgaris]